MNFNFTFIFLKSKPYYSRRGFSLVQLMVSLAVLGVLSLAAMSALRGTRFLTGDTSLGVQTADEAKRLQKIISEDLQRVVFLNPRCNSATSILSNVYINCIQIRLLGGSVPLPGRIYPLDFQGMAEAQPPMTSLTTLANVAPPMDRSDAVRLITYRDQTNINCRLLMGQNFLVPSEETLVIDSAFDPNCASMIHRGGLYVISERLPGSLSSKDLFANIFQITAITPAGTRQTLEISSTTSIFNQLGGMEASGFTDAARIFPVQIVEWMHDPASLKIYRRQIVGADADGFLDFGVGAKVLASNVERLNFYPRSQSTLHPEGVEHPRMISTSMDPNFRADRLSDILGFGVEFVLRSAKESSNTQRDRDDPLIPDLQHDRFLRTLKKFFVFTRGFEAT